MGKYLLLIGQKGGVVNPELNKKEARDALKRLVDVYCAYTAQPKTSSATKVGAYKQLGDLIGIGEGTFSDKLGKAYKAGGRQEFLSQEQIMLLVSYFEDLDMIDQSLFRSLVNNFRSACNLPVVEAAGNDVGLDDDLEKTIPTEYEVVNKTLKYIVSDSGKLDISRKYTIRPNVSRLRIMPDQFIWTGSQSEAELPIPISGIDRIAPGEQNRVIWKRFEIFFDPPLEQGQPHILEYGWRNMTDFSPNSAPFISTSTDEITQEITFEIRLGAEYAGETVFFEEFRAIEAMNTIHYERLVFDEQGSFAYSFEPKLFRHYRVRWNWHA